MRFSFSKSSLYYPLFALLGLAALGSVFWLDAYKKELLQEIEKVADANLEGKLRIGDVGFTPFKHGIGLTFSFSNVELNDVRIARYGLPLLRAKSVVATLNLGHLMRGDARVSQIAVDQGTFSVFVTHDGYSNASLFDRIRDKIAAGKSEQNPKGFFEALHTIKFYDCPVNYVDSLKNKKYAATFQEVEGRLGRTDSTRHFDLGGAVLFRGLTFNPKKGTYLRAKQAQVFIDFDYNPGRKRWRINPSTVKVTDPKVDTIRLSGTVDLAPNPGRLALDFNVNRTDLGPTLRLLPKSLEKTLRKRKILPLVQANIHLESALGSLTPLITIGFQTDTFSYALPYGTLRGLKAKGAFSNCHDPSLPASDTNSRIEVNQVAGYLETIPLQGSLSVDNLKVPNSVMDFTLSATPATVNALLSDDRYRFVKGTGLLKFHYGGSPIKFYDPESDRMTGKLRGTLELSEVGLRNDSAGINLNQLNGDISFDEGEVEVSTLTMHDGRNDLSIKGVIRDLPAALFGSPRPAEAFVHVSIPSWNVTWPDRLVGMKKRGKAGRRKFKLTRILGETIGKLRVTAKLESERLQYHKLSARQLRGTFSIREGLIELKNLSMKTCGGTVALSGGFKTNQNLSRLTLPVFFAQGSVKNADVESVFRSLSNFGQTTVTNRNLRGNLSADFAFEAKVSNDTAFVLPSMKGFVNLSLKKVSILNFKPMLNIRKLIFKNRAWDDVQLAPLRTKLLLRGEDILVNRMKIQANVLYFFLDGIYSFGNNTNLSIQIPMNNLKRKLPKNQLEIVEVEDVKGEVIYLRAQNQGNEVKIRYDKMKRFR